MNPDLLVAPWRRPIRLAAGFRRSRVLACRRRYLLDGRPVEFAVSYLPLDLARNTPIAEPNPGPGGIYARLEELGHRLDHFDEEVRARMPTPERRARSGSPPVCR